MLVEQAARIVSDAPGTTGLAATPACLLDGWERDETKKDLLLLREREGESKLYSSAA